ncbi:Shedu immune nuclease family protein [Nitrosococcus oceani]|uniref:Shedu immune nuclease family protein n=1 Tax=Nitrosococcus oceani TaxID=1229 RepID=UPI000B029C9F|nr:Shedu immune nuclease family protein [Nitrosococcus oceani]
MKDRKNCTDEGLWQQYFEKNTWIFGYGLGYLFLSSLDDKKLEQVVQGYSITTHGKRVDALMKTKGIISSLCFVEIKTHKTPLLESKSYRSGCWAPSKELSGAVSQMQGTVSSAINNLRNKVILEDKEGNPTGEEVFNYQPKSYLVIGSLSEFEGDHGVNIEKYRSFELYRKNTINPEIITFDELYERARYIVHQNES